MTQVTPCVGVWIETAGAWSYQSMKVSHPAWVCGLKLLASNAGDQPNTVTPCVGVWIETSRYDTDFIESGESHPAWVCGLKLSLLNMHRQCWRHTLRGCVD